MKPIFFAPLAALLCLGACNSVPNKPSGPSCPKVDSLMQVMTLEEKIGQLVLFTSDWSVTGPSMRDNYLEDIRAGREDTVDELMAVLQKLMK